MSEEGVWETLEKLTGSLESDVISLRDLFAAAALCGLRANPAFSTGDDATAKRAYNLADAMMKARNVLPQK